MAVTEPDVLSNWRHKKRGTIYYIVGNARSQSINPHFDDLPMVIYRSIEDGQLWCRPTGEFLDGRFDPVPGIG